MTSPARLGARLFAAALAFTLLPAFAFAQEAAPAVHPWKLAYARRMAREGMEMRERRERRERALHQTAHKPKPIRRKPAPPAGARARPAVPDYAFTLADAYSPARAARPFGARAFAPPVNRIVNDRTGDGAQSGQCETSIAAFGDLMLAAWNDSEPGVNVGDTQGWATSNDGGVSWADHGTFPKPGGVTGFRWTSDPVLTLNEKTGAFYFSALCDFNNAQGARSGVAVVKGRWNAGVFTWGTPVIARDVDAFADFVDKEWVVADSVSGRVYLSYTRFPADIARIEFQWADSSLASWSAPQMLSLNNVAENGFVQGSRPIVDGDGRLYVVYELIGSDVADFFRICRSDNLGVSFTAPATAVSMYTNFGTGAPGFNRGHGVEFCGIAVDRSHGPDRGRLFLSWAESINWLDEVFTLGASGDKSEVETNNTFTTATPIVVGQTVRGSVGGLSDAVDYYRLVLAQGDHLVVASDSLQSSAREALHLRLVAGDGITQLTHATIDAFVSPAGWLFTAPTAGTYYLRVSPRNGTGAYRLRTGLVHRGTERGRDQRDTFVGWSDDGTTWSEPVRLNEDAIGLDAFLPEVAVAADGGVYAAWYDYRDAPAATNGGESSVYLARSGDGGTTWTTLGAVTDTLSNWTTALSNIEPNQGDYMSLVADASHVRMVWSDGRRGDPDSFSAQIPLIPNGSQVAFTNVRLGNRRITMDWNATPADTLTMRLYRSQDGGAYQYLDLLQFSLTGPLSFSTLSYTDTTVTGDHTYAYRLGRFTNGVELFYGQVRVFLPSTFPLFMAAPRPNPVVGNSFTASFSLATNEPADLILHDITGREVFRQTISPGMGPHTLALPVGSGLKQGFYVLTLRQGGHNTSTRVHLLR